MNPPSLLGDSISGWAQSRVPAHEEGWTQRHCQDRTGLAQLCRLLPVQGRPAKGEGKRGLKNNPTQLKGEKGGYHIPLHSVTQVVSSLSWTPERIPYLESSVMPHKGRTGWGLSSSSGSGFQL